MSTARSLSWITEDGTSQARLSNAVSSRKRPLEDTGVSSSLPPQPRNRNDFKIAIICALPIEAGMVELVFDHYWNEAYGKALGDSNAYVVGVIGKHNVVLTCMPKIGGITAATTAAGVRSSFPNVTFAFVVGICGIVPFNLETDEELLLGDCIISTSMVQYDLGRQYPNRFERKSNIEDSLGAANSEIRSFLALINTPRNQRELTARLGYHLETLQHKTEASHVKYPGIDHDRLFISSYLHKHRPEGQRCKDCLDDERICTRDCDSIGCETIGIVERKRLQQIEPNDRLPKIHFGRFGSANTVLKSGMHRDILAKDEHLIAFEMEGSGVWEILPTIVIKSASDYADSHKQKEWQPYAAASAAAGLKTVLERLEVSEKDSTDQAPSAASQMKSVRNASRAIWLLPFGRDEDFVGRQDILRQLWEFKNQKQPEYQLRAALVGMGGIGKSQVAIEWAYQLRKENEYLSVFWIHASTAARFEQGYRDIAVKSGIPSEGGTMALEIVCSSLSSKTAGPWIMILDNLDDDKVFTELRSDGKTLRDFIPTSPNGVILVTGRSQIAASNISRNKTTISLDLMPSKDCLKLLQTRVRVSAENLTHAEQLVRALGFLPLAISHAGNYISTRKINIHSYLELFERNKTRLLENEDFKDLRRDNSAAPTILTTWQISFESIAKQNQNAAGLFSMMCMFDNQSIPKILLYDKRSASSNNSSIDLEENLSFLRSYSMITSDAEDGPVSIHPLVQLSMTRWLQTNNNLREWQAKSIEHVNAAILPLGIPKDNQTFKVLLPHVQKVLEYGVITHNPEDSLRYIDPVSTYLANIGYLLQSQKLCDQALKQCETNLEQDHWLTLYLMYRLSAAYLQLRRLEEAETIITYIIERSRSTSETGTLLLRSMWTLSEIQYQQGKLDQANNLSRYVLDQSAKVLGPEHEVTLSCQDTLSRILIRQGNLRQAEQQIRMSYERYVEKGGIYHHRSIWLMTHLGRVLRDLKKREEAEILLRQAFHASLKLWGLHYPVTIESMSSLATVVVDPIEAEELHQEAIRLSLEVLGPEHPDTLRISRYLADFWYEKGQLKNSLVIIRDVFDISERTLGSGHRDTEMCFTNLISVLLKLDQLLEAEKLLSKALPERQQRLGSEDPLTKEIIKVLGDIRKKQDKLDDIERLSLE